MSIILRDSKNQLIIIQMEFYKSSSLIRVGGMVQNIQNRIGLSGSHTFKY